MTALHDALRKAATTTSYLPSAHPAGRAPRRYVREERDEIFQLATDCINSGRIDDVRDAVEEASLQRYFLEGDRNFRAALADLAGGHQVQLAKHQAPKRLCPHPKAAFLFLPSTHFAAQAATCRRNNVFVFAFAASLSDPALSDIRVLRNEHRISVTAPTADRIPELHETNITAHLARLGVEQVFVPSHRTPPHLTEQVRALGYQIQYL